MTEELLINELQRTEIILKELHIPKYIRRQYPKVTPTGAKERCEKYAELFQIILQGMRESPKQ
ncbi:hypothetical protein ACFLUB_00250 [Chloroflexota bacterium]